MPEMIITMELPVPIIARGTSQSKSRAYSPEGKPKAPPQWIVYAIQNSAGRIYIGQTGNLRQRVKAHNAGVI